VQRIRVASWNELNERLYEASWQESIRRFRSHFAFRGMSNADYEPMTSLERLGPRAADLEGHLLRNFRKYAVRNQRSHGSIWNWLALGQHHGLPTRLFDWTYSPYVALHFATEDLDHYHEDGAIWCVDYVKAHQLLPRKLKEILREEGSDVFTVDMLHQAAGTLEEFEELDSVDFVIFFEPPSLDDRIVNQFALFSMMSRALASLGRWLEEHPELAHVIIIPRELKWEVRDKLDQANINERVLFPGLDGLSRWLHRQYTPREDKSFSREPPASAGEQRTPETRG
jgi:hypothetical protein